MHYSGNPRHTQSMILTDSTYMFHFVESRTVESAIDVFTDIGIVFACLGLIIFALAFTGCVGVLRQNIRLLK